MTEVALPPLPVVDRDKPIPMEAIRAVVALIVAKFKPKKVILFVSYAYGNPEPWSDVDLLVVIETELTERQQRLEISWFLHDRPFSMDINVRTPTNLEWRLKEGDFFLMEIVGKGKVLYEKPND